MQSFLPAAESIDLFLTDLIKDKYGKDINPPLLQEFKQDLEPRLTKWIMLKTMTEVAKHSQTDLQTLQKMTEEDKPAEEVQAFIQHIIPDSTSFLTKTLLGFRQTYIGAA
jgi:hypothetical protein